MLSIKDIVSLQKDKKTRDRLRSFFVDGVNMVKAAIENDWKISQLVIVEESIDNQYKQEIVAKVDPRLVMKVPKKAYEKLATKNLIQGCGAVVETKEMQIGNGLVVALESPRNPGNVGTIMRSLLGLGVKELLIVKPAVDIYHPEAVRASMGAIFGVRVMFVENLDEALDFAKKRGYENWCFDRGSGTVPLKKMADSLSRTDKKLIWFGNEGAGLSKKIMDSASKLINIETSDEIDSLNLAEAVSIGLYTLLP